MRQKFGVGDVALCSNPRGEDFKVKIVTVFQDEDGRYWYEVEPLEFNSFTREVFRLEPQVHLKNI